MHNLIMEKDMLHRRTSVLSDKLKQPSAGHPESRGRSRTKLFGECSQSHQRRVKQKRAAHTHTPTQTHTAQSALSPSSDQQWAMGLRWLVAMLLDFSSQRCEHLGRTCCQETRSSVLMGVTHGGWHTLRQLICCARLWSCIKLAPSQEIYSK